MRKAKNILLLLVCSFLMVQSCAIVKAPKGGPEDKEPPEILMTFPKDGSKNFKETYAEIEFSEYVNHQSVFENLFITPEIEYDLKWNRNKVKVVFRDTLSSEYTYTLTLGTSVTDLKKNPLPQAYSIAFSISNKIDTGFIKGKVFDIKGDNPYVFAYPLGEKLLDSLDITVDKPKYKIPIGKEGDFQIKALKDGKYRVVSVSDVFKDGSYDIDADNYSSATEDYTVVNGKSSFALLQSGAVFDTIKPYIADVNSNYCNIFTLSYSENLPPKYYAQEYIYILDSLTKDTVAIRGCYFSKEKNMLNIIPEDFLDTNSYYQLFAKGVKDSADNEIAENSYLSFRCFSDTNHYGVNLKEFLPLAKGSALPSDTMKVSFAFPIDSASLSEAITLQKNEKDTTIDISSKIKSINLAEYAILAEPEIDYNSAYSITFDMSKIKNNFGASGADTSFTHKFKTYSKSTLSAISGTIKYSGKESLIIIISSGKKIHKTRVGLDRKWRFENVVAGDYNVDIFIDENKNGKYDYGSPEPYQFAEKYYPQIANLTIKKGWDTEDVKISLDKLADEDK